MGTVITVMNMKGGVGKTTVTLHLGGLLALRAIEGKRRKVLLIDYDPQFNLSQAFIPPKDYFALEKDRRTTVSILVEDERFIDPFHIQVPGNENPPSVADLAYKLLPQLKDVTLDIVPSTLDLMYIALGDLQQRGKIIEERFAKFIQEARKKYELIFIDCHPAGSIFTKTSLRNSDHVLIPVKPSERYAVRGIGLMLRFIQAKSLGGSSPTAHILFNNTYRGGESGAETSIRASEDFQPFCLNNTLHYYRAFSQPEDGEGFVWFSGKPWSTRAYYNLYAVAEEFIKRIRV
jgi:chromosome partitioning protein